ncbi:hypothetical protein [Ketobacter sp.]|uniref:hypothetical protein n=1 Tax=Ketobacter sp. TaxID=2083498 RepID=UPI0025B93955|nr:hypothetical protein [Ketobacter sp.]
MPTIFTLHSGNALDASVAIYYEVPSAELLGAEPVDNEEMENVEILTLSAAQLLGES